MLRPRITPVLLVHKGGLVKTVEFKSPKYIGDPINAVKIFNEKEADELTVLDIDATVAGVEPNFAMIGHLAAECRMPLCYGGGIRTAEQAKRIVSLGVEKVALSSAAIGHPERLSRIAGEIGSQSVVVVCDVRKNAATQEYELWTHNGTRNTTITLPKVLADTQVSGAGEILINSIDRDGTMSGYDLELAEIARRSTSLPLTILGGAGSLANIAQLVTKCGVVGAAAGSLFVFKGAYRAVLINYPTVAQKDELVRGALAAGQTL